MKNYQDSDYALNRYSDGIVYRFADGSKFTVTMADYIAENPGKTEDDFRALKELSDSDYLQQDRSGNAQTKKDKPLSQAALAQATSPEELLIRKIDACEEAENRRARLTAANRALDTLTEKQRRRYLMYAVGGMTVRQIAVKEGVPFQDIGKSVLSAEKKIKKYFSRDGKIG